MWFFSPEFCETKIFVNLKDVRSVVAFSFLKLTKSIHNNCHNNNNNNKHKFRIFAKTKIWKPQIYKISTNVQFRSILFIFVYIYIFFGILFTANFKGVEITIMKKSTTKMHYKPQIQIVYSIQRERETHRKKRKRSATSILKRQ